MHDSMPLPIPSQEWPDKLAGVLNDLHGEPENIHKIMANSPDLLIACWPIRNYLIDGSSIGKRKSEIAALRLAVHMNCWYEWASRSDRALRLGIEVEEMLGLLEPVAERPWVEEERALIMAIDDLVEHRRIRPVTLAILDKNYSNQQVMDIITLHGVHATLAGMVTTWGLTLDQDTVGRVSHIIDEYSFKQRSEDISAC